MLNPKKKKNALHVIIDQSLHNGRFLANLSTTNHSYFIPSRVSERKKLKKLQTEDNSYCIEVDEAAYVVSLLDTY